MVLSPEDSLQPYTSHSKIIDSYLYNFILDEQQKILAIEHFTALALSDPYIYKHHRNFFFKVRAPLLQLSLIHVSN